MGNRYHGYYDTYGTCRCRVAEAGLSWPPENRPATGNG